MHIGRVVAGDAIFMIACFADAKRVANACTPGFWCSGSTFLLLLALFVARCLP